MLGLISVCAGAGSSAEPGPAAGQQPRTQRDLTGQAPSAEAIVEAFSIRPEPAPAARAGEVSVLLNVTFARDSARLDGNGQGLVRALADALNSPALAGARFMIEGHTDRTGTFAHNMTLSVNRAQTVYLHLIALGVAPGRLGFQGFGPTRLIAGIPPDDIRHRRVEVVRGR